MIHRLLSILPTLASALLLAVALQCPMAARAQQLEFVPVDGAALGTAADTTAAA